MNAIPFLLESPLTHYLGWTLVHFLWQGAAVGIGYGLLRSLLRSKSPVGRYYLAMGTLMVLAILPVVTFIYLSQGKTEAGIAGLVQVLPALTSTGNTLDFAGQISPLEHLKLWLQPLVPWTVPLWCLGVSLMTLRFRRGWRQTRELRATAQFIPLPHWQSVVESLRSLLGIRLLVRLAVSTEVTVPCVIGWLKPAILIPPSVITGLTPVQMELILAHELAHIRRQDYLWNFLQVAVETLLFYHPVVRWISHHARLEREQCCDDMVVNLHGNAMDYARALTELESLRRPRAALLLGADGGHVMERVYRVAGLPLPNASLSWWPLVLAASLVCIGGFIQFAAKPSALLPAMAVSHPSPVALKHETATPQLQRVAAVIPAVVKVPVLSVSIPTSEAVTPILNALAEIQPPAIPTLPPPSISELGLAQSQPSKPTAPVREGGEVLARFAPAYPSLALERGVEGSATVEFTLTPEAQIANVRVIHMNGSRLFGEAAMEALRKWKFTPVRLAGRPVTQEMSQQFVFRLHGPSDTGNGPCKIPMGYHVCTNQ